MTFPMNYNLSKPKEESIQCVQCKKELYDLGITEVTTPGGNTVNAYNAERTLCDILRAHSRVDIQIVTEAFKHYVVRSNKNIPILSEYAKVLRVEAKLNLWIFNAGTKTIVENRNGLYRYSKMKVGLPLKKSIC